MDHHESSSKIKNGVPDLRTMILNCAKFNFVLSESPFWPKFPLSCFSFGTQIIMVSNGSLGQLDVKVYLNIFLICLMEMARSLSWCRRSSEVANKNCFINSLNIAGKIASFCKSRFKYHSTCFNEKKMFKLDSKSVC